MTENILDHILGAKVSPNIGFVIFSRFFVHFPNSLGKIFPPENPALSCITSYGFLAPYQFRKKLMIKLQEIVRTDRRPEGEKDGHRLFYRILSATAGGPRKDSNFLIKR